MESGLKSCGLVCQIHRIRVDFSRIRKEIEKSCGFKTIRIRVDGTSVVSTHHVNKQLLDEVEHDMMNYQNRGLCYLPQPSASEDNTDTRF